MTGVNAFLDKVGTQDGSGYGYTGPQATPRMSAAGLFSREQTGWGPKQPALVKGLETMRKLPPAAAFKDMYYYYYATQTVRNLGGDAWKAWNEKMRNQLISTQDQGQNGDKRDQKGSWDPTGDAFGAQFGRLGMTSFCILTLEVYYRHVPLYPRDKQ
ncbi:MAG: hypothetical protein K2R98_08020 [Gemmataceae bacterium]|nr:hypothetical protein [Gemmataceae bacterium]